jgi:hypothetical protein
MEKSLNEVEFVLARELNQQITTLDLLEYNRVMAMRHNLNQYLKKDKKNGFGN